MTLRVGIPRALFYYYFFPAWEVFFKELGAEVVLSSPTHKNIVNAGVTTAVDEACLPVKVYYGHVLELIPKVDLLFIPRLVSVEAKTYICPKFMGLPDMIQANIPQLPEVIDLCVDISRNDRQYRRELNRTASRFTHDQKIIDRAEKAASKRLEEFRQAMEQGRLPQEAIDLMSGIFRDNSMPAYPGQPGETNCHAAAADEGESSLNIALLGHGYTIYDEYVSHKVVDKLRQLGANVTTPEVLPSELIEKEAQRLPKRMFWTLGKKIIGAAYHFLESPRIDGIIHLACFGCGPDSLVAELVEIEAHRRKRPPFMMLTLDEHTGEAGMVTRLEAFIDLVKRVKKNKTFSEAG